MKLNSVQIVDWKSAAEAINLLNEDDLRTLNRMIVQRFKELARLRAAKQMSKFTKGDWVEFQMQDGSMMEGLVLRLNKKTVCVLTKDGDQWTVSPSLLRLVESVRDL